MDVPLEKVAEGRTVDRARGCGWIVRKLMFIGVRGAPDQIFGKDGRTVAIEFKRKGKEPNSQQLKRHNELREQFGWEVYWTDSYEIACAMLGIET